LNTFFKGRAWKFGDNVSTDHIITGKHLLNMNPRELAGVVFENLNPDFSREVKHGDIIIGGKNFGCGSSREAAPIAIKASGIEVVVAEYFARIFYRNAMNIGLVALECPGVSRRVNDGDIIEVDIDRCRLVIPGERSLEFKPVPENLVRMLQAGGLVEVVRRELA
jgi:3-isopropylmalate/(R)-2-methylmalate dehydratase small subunit